MRGVIPDLAGQRFGRWTVVAFAGNAGADRRSRWLCRCNCGAERVVYSSSLLRGRSTSCGCLRNEKSRARWIGRLKTGKWPQGSDTASRRRLHPRPNQVLDDAMRSALQRYVSTIHWRQAATALGVSVNAISRAIKGNQVSHNTASAIRESLGRTTAEGVA